MSASVSNAILVKITINGNNGVGAIQADGVEPGDVLMKMIPRYYQYWFEEVITVADELQQHNENDLSSMEFDVYLLRAGQ